MKTNKQSWFEILQAARTLSQKGPFGSADLARAAGLEDTLPSEMLKGKDAGKIGKGSTAQQIASGWLGKFVKWGYVIVTGKVQTGGPRPAFVYQVTPAGMTCAVRPGLRARLLTLIAAVDRLKELKGKGGEISAYQDLLKVANEVRPQETEGEEDGE